MSICLLWGHTYLLHLFLIVKISSTRLRTSIIQRTDDFVQVRFPNLEELQQERAREFREEQKAEKRSAFEKEKLAEKDRIKTAQLKSYAYVSTTNIHLILYFMLYLCSNIICNCVVN